MTVKTSQSRNELIEANLPPHLKAMLIEYFDKCDTLGINPDWTKQALDKANNKGNDFNPIHGMIN